jgi:hypothetical protein
VIRNLRAAALGAVFIALALGCGKKPPPPIVPAEGVVRLDGKPLNKVAVRFIPQIDDGADYIASGVTDEAGHFQLTCKGKPGACACANQVVVAETDLPPELKGEKGHPFLDQYRKSLGGRPLPPRYTSLVESPLTADVKAGQTEYPLELNR